MKHTLTFENKGKKFEMPLWALVDEFGYTIQQVYSIEEPTGLKKDLEKPIDNYIK